MVPLRWFFGHLGPPEAGKTAGFKNPDNRSPLKTNGYAVEGQFSGLSSPLLEEGGPGGTVREGKLGGVAGNS